MMKVMTVFGTRPEAVKMAPLVNELKKDNQLETIVCVTAQHREMLDTVLELFNIEPEYDLNIMKHGQTIVDITNRVMAGVDRVIKETNPDIILVHGDTTTSFAAGLAAFYNQVQVGHVEAGLRSGNIYSPYPEEMNRKLTGTIANQHFAPTENNKNNLLAEGVKEEQIMVTGNTVIDALLQVVEEDYKFEDNTLNQIDYDNSKVILLTAHRRENLGQPMVNIFEGVKEVVESNPEVEIIFPVHLNPKVRQIVNGILKDVERVHLTEPLDYQPFANLISKVDLVLTDSGGIQEEAPSLGKPVLVLRTETERPEAVKAGTVKVIGVEKDKIITETTKLIKNKKAYDEMANAVNPYGDGKASQRILKRLHSLK